MWIKALVLYWIGSGLADGSSTWWYSSCLFQLDILPCFLLCPGMKKAEQEKCNSCSAHIPYSVLTLIFSLSFLHPHFKQLDDGIFHLLRSVGTREVFSDSIHRELQVPIFCSIIMPSTASSFSLPSWDSRLIRWACEKDGVACSLSMVSIRSFCSSGLR